MFHTKDFFSKIIFWIDRKILENFNNIIVDTKTNANRYSTLFGVDKNKFSRIFVGSRLLIESFSISPLIKNIHEFIEVGWVGSFIPLHGLEIILEVAKELKSEEKIKFNLIGDGQMFEYSRQYIKNNSLTNVKLLGKQDYQKSMEIINTCDVCLGVFGGSKKSKSVIPFKIFDYLYLQKKVISQKSNALNEIEHKAIHQVEVSAKAIASEIKSLSENEHNIFPCEDLIWNDLIKSFKL